MYRYLRSCLTGIFITAFTLPTFADAWSQQSSRDRRDEQRENAKVRSAAKEVEAAKKKWSETQKNLRAKQRNIDEIVDTLIKDKKLLRSAIDVAEKDIGNSIGIPKAYEKTQQARKELDELAMPVLEKLHRTPQWVQSQSQSNEAKEERRELLADVELDDATRDQKLKDNLSVIQIPNELESSAIDADPMCMVAISRLNDSVAELDAIRKKLSGEEVNSHPKVRLAQKQVEETQRELAAAEKETKALMAASLQAQKLLGLAEGKLKKAKAEDARDPNHGKPRN